MKRKKNENKKREIGNEKKNSIKITIDIL